MQKYFSFFAGAVLGGLVGATLAILLAPNSGEELRIELRGRAQRLQGELKVAATDRRAELERQLASLRASRPSAVD